MPIQQFHGDTAVAFLDMSGFKQMMRNREKAMQTLGQFYEVGFATLRQHRRVDAPSVEGVFVTDCGILFVRHDARQPVEILETLLPVVEDLNRRLFAHDIKATTSVAFGLFRYNPLNEYDGIEKNFVFGPAYIDAFKDNESAPRPDPGTCRILNDNWQHPNVDAMKGHPIWGRCKFCEKHVHFFWMCETPEEIRNVERQYERANQSRFDTIHKTLQDCSRNWNRRNGQL